MDKKEKIKFFIIGTVFGIILIGSIGVTAITLNANQVAYNPSNEKFMVANAKDALDEIYKLAEYKTPADTYFYNSKTKGSSIVRYKKVDGKYYLCDKNGKITDKTEQNVTGITLIEYTTAKSTNLSVGVSGYSANEFILGDGTDTIPPYEDAIKIVVSYTVTLTNSDIAVDYLPGSVTFEKNNGVWKLTSGGTTLTNNYFYGEKCRARVIITGINVYYN